MKKRNILMPLALAFTMAATGCTQERSPQDDQAVQEKLRPTAVAIAQIAIERSSGSQAPFRVIPEIDDASMVTLFFDKQQQDGTRAHIGVRLSRVKGQLDPNSVTDVNIYNSDCTPAQVKTGCADGTTETISVKTDEHDRQVWTGSRSYRLTLGGAGSGGDIISVTGSTEDNSTMYGAIPQPAKVAADVATQAAADVRELLPA